MKQDESVMNLLRAEYSKLESDEIAYPDRLAQKALGRADAKLRSYAALLFFSQYARELCRKQCEVLSPKSGMLFDGMLQERYPATRDGFDCYVPLVQLNELEGRRNVKALRSESATKAQHAERLEAWLDAKFGVKVSAA